MSKLVKGLIPAGRPCPFFNRCEFAQANCPNDKQLKESPFNCKQARRFDALEEASQIDFKIANESAKNAISFASHLNCCINFAGNENDHVFRVLVGHHPRCPKLKRLFTTDDLADRVNSLYTNANKIIAKHKEEIKGLKTELKECEVLNIRMSEILNATTNALKGKPPKLVRYSWHDLAEVAKKKMRKIRKLKRKLRK